MATAFMRALAAHDPRKAIRGTDKLAEIFLDEEKKKPIKNKLARAWVMKNRVTPGIYEFMIARTAFFDQIVEQALKDNVAQIVFLGAGYDSRPYRFEKAIRDTIIFELDTKPTQLRKQDCLRQAQISISNQVRYIPVDFERDDLAGKLVEVGFSKERRTLFVWEGVTYYLNKEVVENILTIVKANAPSGSSICFDYVALSEETLNEQNARQLRDHMKSEHADEPIKFGVRAGEIGSFLAGNDFEIILHLTAEEMTGKYLSGVGQNDIGKIPSMFCLVHAGVR